MDFIAVDFETSSRDEQFICSYAFVKCSGGEIKDILHSHVAPPRMIFDDFCIKLHGITPDQVVNSRELPDHWREILSFIKGFTLVAHWAKRADMTFLDKSLSYYGIEFPRNPWICSRDIAKYTYGLDSNKLNDVAKYLGIKFTHHDAKEDAIIVSHIIHNVVAMYGEKWVNSFLFYQSQKNLSFRDHPSPRKFEYYDFLCGDGINELTEQTISNAIDRLLREISNGIQLSCPYCQSSIRVDKTSWQNCPSCKKLSIFYQKRLYTYDDAANIQHRYIREKFAGIAQRKAKQQQEEREKQQKEAEKQRKKDERQRKKEEKILGIFQKKLPSLKCGICQKPANIHYKTIDAPHICEHCFSVSLYDNDTKKLIPGDEYDRKMAEKSGGAEPPAH